MAPEPRVDYRDRVTFGLLAGVLDLFATYGITWADDEPARRMRALRALTRLAEVVSDPADPAADVDSGGV